VRDVSKIIAAKVQDVEGDPQIEDPSILRPTGHETISAHRLPRRVARHLLGLRRVGARRREGAADDQALFQQHEAVTPRLQCTPVGNQWWMEAHSEHPHHRELDCRSLLYLLREKERVREERDPGVRLAQHRVVKNAT
jgi:hypothetical protein